MFCLCCLFRGRRGQQLHNLHANTRCQQVGPLPTAASSPTHRLSRRALCSALLLQASGVLRGGVPLGLGVAGNGACGKAPPRPGRAPRETPLAKTKIPQTLQPRRAALCLSAQHGDHAKMYPNFTQPIPLI